MRCLSYFFNLDMFLENVVLTCNGVSEYKDYGTGEHLGTKISAVITEDHTQYFPRADGRQVTNRFEKLNINVRKDMQIPLGAVIRPVGNMQTSIYGDRHDQMSIKCDNVEIVQPQAQARPQLERTAK